jgi:hypothetical protein
VKTEGDAWLSELDTSSLQVVSGCLACPLLASAKPGDRYQFERLG